MTTAHCFNLNVAEKNYLFFRHAGFVAIESATRHPAYVAAFPPNTLDCDVLRVEDISFIKLEPPRDCRRLWGVLTLPEGENWISLPSS